MGHMSNMTCDHSGFFGKKNAVGSLFRRNASPCCHSFTVPLRSKYAVQKQSKQGAAAADYCARRGSACLAACLRACLTRRWIVVRVDGLSGGILTGCALNTGLQSCFYISNVA